MRTARDKGRTRSRTELGGGVRGRGKESKGAKLGKGFAAGVV